MPKRHICPATDALDKIIVALDDLSIGEINLWQFHQRILQIANETLPKI